MGYRGMARLLRYLLPDENGGEDNGLMQWAFFIVCMLLAVYIIIRGIGAVRHQYVRGKWGREYHGNTAQVLGVIYILLGIAFLVVGIYVMLFGPLL